MVYPIEREIHNVKVANHVERIIHVKLVGRTNVIIALKAEIVEKWPNRWVQLASTELIDDDTAGSASRESIEQVIQTPEWAEFSNRLLNLNFPVEPGHIREEVIPRQDVRVGDLLRVEMYSLGMKQTREGIARVVERDCVKVDEYNYLITKNEDFNGAIITRITYPIVKKHSRSR